jgi:radical SAM protein with 4Fe4S-binding SPASM domain
MDWMFYIKTTETCNLNCKHCFTSGRNGKKIYFDPVKTSQWVNQFKDLNFLDTAHFEFHGGEPFLAPIEDMWKFYELTQKWNATYSATSNLTFKLTPDKLEFMDVVCQKRLGTSWDPNIRFENDKQLKLWENNVRTLIDRGYEIKLFVSLTKQVIDMEPIDLINYAKQLGVQEIDIERLTLNGYAKQNLDIFPTNIETQEWFLKMHMQNTRELLYNVFMENVYTKFETGFTGAGTFCRDCEQKMFTINADGTIAGCPNSAPEDHYATLDDLVVDVLKNQKRCGIIANEVQRDERCYTCPVFQYCGSDCHQLQWEGDVCPAPKKLMMHLHENNKR